MQSNTVASQDLALDTNSQQARIPSFLSDLLGRWSGLRMQMVIPYAVLTLLAAMAGIYVITRLVSSSVRERFVNQLVEANRVAGDLIVQREEVHLENLRLMAFTQGVPEAILENDADRIESLLYPLVLNENVHSLTVVNLEGTEIISMVKDPESDEYQLSYGGDLSDLELVTLPLSGFEDDVGDKFSSLENTSYGYYILTSAPVYNADSQLTGALIVGTYLDSLAADLKAQALADIIVLDHTGALLATTFPQLGENFSELSLSTTEVSDIHPSLTKEYSLSLRNYEAIYAPLVVRQTDVGIVGVALPTNFIVSTEAISRNSLSLVFTIATAAIVVIGILLAYTIAKPILRLRDVALTVASGDLNQRSGLHRRDEIGQLAESFDTMITNLQERTVELVQSEKLSAVGHLSAGIAHDVKNPLAVIIGLAEEVQDDARDNPDMVGYLKTISANASRADAIISDLMTFTRQSNYEVRNQNICDSINRSVRLTTYLARQSNVHVVVEHEDDAIMLSYDGQQIDQVFTNLIQNAIQAMPEGGELIIATKREGKHAMIGFRDTGSGIPEESVARIFDPFFTTKPEGEGTGLGLSVSQGIIKKHNGKIMVDSEVGVGTSFIVYLPLDEGEAQ